MSIAKRMPSLRLSTFGLGRDDALLDSEIRGTVALKYERFDPVPDMPYC
jgi:hypothetical protein